jgi:hypothetical protein
VENRRIQREPETVTEHLEIRAAYVGWLRRAAPLLAVVPLLLTGLIQVASSSAWWSAGPAPSGSVRYMFLAVAVAGLVVGRNVRDRDTAAQVRPVGVAKLVSLSWELVFYALAPVIIGAVLALMTRQQWDFYALLFATLIGIGVLFPRFDQWAAWASAPPAGDA